MTVCTSPDPDSRAAHCPGLTVRIDQTDPCVAIPYGGVYRRDVGMRRNILAQEFEIVLRGLDRDYASMKKLLCEPKGSKANMSAAIQDHRSLTTLEHPVVV